MMLCTPLHNVNLVLIGEKIFNQRCLLVLIDFVVLSPADVYRSFSVKNPESAQHNYNTLEVWSC